jgi:hypothetical protein
MSKQNAIKLLRSHRDDVAQAILKGVDRLAPGMAQVDARARHASILAIVDAFADALRSGDTRALTSLLRNSTRLRAAGGVPREELLASSHAYMPGVRTVFLRAHADHHEALAAYEAVEAMALPLIADFSRVVLQFDPKMLDEEPTHPGRDPPLRRGPRKGSPASPFDSVNSSERTE